MIPRRVRLLVTRISVACVLGVSIASAGMAAREAAPIGSAASSTGPVRTRGPARSCTEYVSPAPLRVLAEWDSHLVESEHFVVRYETSGPDSIFRPDLPNELLEDLEYTYRALSTDPQCAMHVPSGTYDTAQACETMGLTTPSRG